MPVFCVKALCLQKLVNNSRRVWFCLSDMLFCFLFSHILSNVRTYSFCAFDCIHLTLETLVWDNNSSAFRQSQSFVSVAIDFMNVYVQIRSSMLTRTLQGYVVLHTHSFSHGSIRQAVGMLCVLPLWNQVWFCIWYFTWVEFPIYMVVDLSHASRVFYRYYSFPLSLRSIHIGQVRATRQWYPW